MLTKSELRALTYKLASELLDYPYDLNNFKQKLSDFVSVLGLIDSDLGKKANKILSIFEKEIEMGEDYFQAEYVSIFELGVPKPMCPPIEREYVEDKYEKVLDDITDFYGRFGIFVEKENPDNLIVELEFMSYLVMQEGTEKDQKEFLDSHILRWIDRFYKCVSNGKLKTYSELVDVIRSFVYKDREAFA